MNKIAGSIKCLLLIVTLWLGIAQAQQQPERFGFGAPATAADIAAIDIDIKPDGKALPPGSGTVSEGEILYNAKCAVCHGIEGAGTPNDRLVVHSPDEPFPDAGDVNNSFSRRSIGNYWPYATTVFDYIRRSMPMNLPGSLSDDEVYALTAYLLYLNHIVPAEIELDAKALADVEMPARNKFVPDDRQQYREVH